MESLFYISIVIVYFIITMFLNLYVFSIIGMELFKGAVFPGLEALKGMDFDVLGYYDCCTFNTIVDAMFTTFHLMVTNNWIVTAKAHIKATTPWAFIYFVVYYFMTFVVLLSLLIATIVETFLYKLKQVEKLEHDIIERELAEYKPGTHNDVLNNEEWHVSSRHLETNATMFAQTVYSNDEELNKIRIELRKDTITPSHSREHLVKLASPDTPSATPRENTSIQPPQTVDPYAQKPSQIQDGLPPTTNSSNNGDHVIPHGAVMPQKTISRKSSSSSNASVASNLTPRNADDVQKTM